jgi:5-methylcytosine-specific restriction endonuclease McrA
MAETRKYSDRREELIKAVAKRRRKIKALSIEYKGGKCQSCGYNKYAGALELHHLDATKKSFGISDKGYTRSWDKVKAELDKCILLCANCHREVSAGILQLPHESVVENEVNSENSIRIMDNPEPSPLLDLEWDGVETIFLQE